MKRLALAAMGAALSLFAVLLAAPTAMASPFYATASVEWAGLNWNGKTAALAPKAMLGTNLTLGYTINPFVSVEAGYLGFWGQDTALNALAVKQAVHADIQGAAADVLVGFPLGQRLRMFADGGLLWATGDVSQGPLSASDSAFGWRAGPGVAIALNDHLSLRARALYQQANLRGNTGAIVGDVGLVLRL